MMEKGVERVLRVKDPEMRRIYALNEILKRYYTMKEELFDLDLVIESLENVISKKTDKYQKKLGELS